MRALSIRQPYDELILRGTFSQSAGLRSADQADRVPPLGSPGSSACHQRILFRAGADEEPHNPSGLGSFGRRSAENRPPPSKPSPAEQPPEETWLPVAARVLPPPARGAPGALPAKFTHPVVDVPPSAPTFAELESWRVDSFEALQSWLFRLATDRQFRFPLHSKRSDHAIAAAAGETAVPSSRRSDQEPTTGPT